MFFYSRSDRGFTLIELLVVIAVIAVLASILFPVFAKARETSRKSACSSNLRNIQQAVLMYAQDSNECMPLEIKLQYSSPAYGTHTVLQSYTKSPEIFRCPSDVGDLANATPIWQRFGTSYKVEGRCFSNPWDEKMKQPIIRKLSQLDMGVDIKKQMEGKPQEEDPSISQLQLMRDLFFPWEYGKEMKNEKLFVRYMHRTGANVVFLDGSIRYVKSKAEWEDVRGKVGD